MRVALASLLLLISTVYSSFGQTFSNDSLFLAAREAAFAGKYNTARELTAQILTVDSQYHDASLLEIRTWLWEKDYAQGLLRLEQLLLKIPDNTEAQLLQLQAYHWAGLPDSIVNRFQELSIANQQSPAFRIWLAEAKHALGDYPASLLITEQLIISQPDLPGLQRLHQRNLQLSRRHHLQVDYQWSTFDAAIPNWHWLAVEYGQQLKHGPLLVRATQISRFNLDATQLEVESYPRINDKTYLYAGAGVGQGILFPQYRIGFEAFRTAWRTYEWSAGWRYIHFSDANIHSFTGSLSKYHGSMWFNARTFIIPTAGNVYLTANVQARKYFENARHWLAFTLGVGNSPDMDFRLNNPADAPSDQIYVLDATLLRLDYQRPVGNYWSMMPFAEYKNEEFLPGNFRTRYTLGLALKRIF